MHKVFNDVGLSIVETDLQLYEMATEWSNNFAARFPELTPAQTADIFTYFAVIINGVTTLGGKPPIPAATRNVLINLAVGLAASGFVAGAKETSVAE